MWVHSLLVQFFESEEYGQFWVCSFMGTIFVGAIFVIHVLGIQYLRM